MKQYCNIDDFLCQQPVRPGRTLVAGSHYYPKKAADRRTLYTDVVGVDMVDGPGVDVVHDLEQPLPPALGLFDHVDCVSMLEHCQRPWLAAQTLLAALVPGGTLLVCAPFVWRVHAYPSDYWRYTVESFGVLFPGIEWLERGYLLGDVFRKVPQSRTDNGKRYMERAEAVGFGLLVS